MSDVNTNLRQVRTRASLSQEALAQQAGISRQAYSAIESGRSVPSTEVALRLARALRTSVESLFFLRETPPEMVQAELVGAVGAGPHPPQRVRLMRVGQRLLAQPLSGELAVFQSLVDAEGLTQTGYSEDNRVAVQPFDSGEAQAPSLVMSGCDPAVALLGPALQQQGVRLVWTEESSRGALAGLARGEAHVAGCHLRDEGSNSFNVAWVRQLVPFSCTLVTFAIWRQGLILAPGNPKHIYGIADLGRPEVSIINRQPGSGSRSLLDRQLQQAGIPASAVSGYHREVRGHLALASVVASGLVDAGVGVQAVATAMGLEFITLEEERYDLAIPNHFLGEPGVQTLLDLLSGPSLRRRVEALGGYDTTIMGQTASE